MIYIPRLREDALIAVVVNKTLVPRLGMHLGPNAGRMIGTPHLGVGVHVVHLVATVDIAGLATGSGGCLGVNLFPKEPQEGNGTGHDHDGQLAVGPYEEWRRFIWGERGQRLEWGELCVCAWSARSSSWLTCVVTKAGNKVGGLDDGKDARAER